MDYSASLGIDLHVHSTASDGTLTPAEILKHAKALNLGAVAITDHDTIDGVKDVLENGQPEGVRFLTGVEMSTKAPAIYPFPGSLHILGYKIDINDTELNAALDDLKAARQNRNPKILECLSDIGFHLTLGDVEKEVGDGQIGRPHIARAMVSKGMVKDINEAFDLYLGKNKPCYVDKYRVAAETAVRLIRNAGGIPVLAHPGILKSDDPQSIENLVSALVNAGLMGIEAFYPAHQPDETAYFIMLAKQYDLLVTGGTDFHGALYPDVEMGSARGDFFVPYAIYEKIINTKFNTDDLI